MVKRVIIVCCILAACLLAGFIVLTPHDLQVMAQAEHQGADGAMYTVTVKRWTDHHRGGRYKRFDDRFRIELLYLGRFPISSYECFGSVLTTNAVITWTKPEEFAVTFDSSVTIRCTWDDHRALWERQ